MSYYQDRVDEMKDEGLELDLGRKQELMSLMIEESPEIAAELLADEQGDAEYQAELNQLLVDGNRSFGDFVKQLVEKRIFEIIEADFE